MSASKWFKKFHMQSYSALRDDSSLLSNEFEEGDIIDHNEVNLHTVAI